MSAELYRHYDRDGRLLYVGISLSTFARLRQHKDKSPWFDDVAAITIERFRTRAEAAKAECKAIKLEKPKWNAVHATGAAIGMDEKQSSAEIPSHLLPFAPGEWRKFLPEGYALNDCEWIAARRVSERAGIGIPAMQTLMRAGCFPRSSSLRGGKITDRYRSDEVDAWVKWNVTRKRAETLRNQGPR